MTEWRKVRLGDIIKTNQNTYSSKEKWLFVNYLDTGNIVKNNIAEIKYIDLFKDKLPSRARRKVSYNNIIYSTVRPNQLHYGIIKEQPENFLVSTGFTVIDVNENEAIADYIYYFLSQNEITEHLQAIGEQSVSAYPSIKPSDIENLEIKLPDIEEQKRIVGILSSIDDKIKNNMEINNNLFAQMEILYKSWFVDYEPFNGSKPETWLETDIYSIADIIYGAPFASKQFNTDGNGKPIIRIRDLKYQNFATYTTEVHPKGYLLQAGDITVGMDGEFRPYIWSNYEAWLNQRVCVFQNKRPYGKVFLYYTIKPLLYAIEQTQVATTVIHIGKKDYDAFRIILPDSKTLDNFDTITTPMLSQIISNNFENKRLATLRDTLLPKLMSSELDISSVEL